MFRYVSDTFQNERGQYVSVENQQNIIVQKSIGNSWSRWNVRYVKDENTYKPGEFHPTYGFYCDRAFIIKSKRDGRVLEQVEDKALTKVQNGRTDQHFYFHCLPEVLTRQKTYVFEQMSTGYGRVQLRGETWARLKNNYPKLPYHWKGAFRYANEELVNIKTGHVVDAGTRAAEGNVVGMNGRNGSIQQKWTIHYLD